MRKLRYILLTVLLFALLLAGCQSKSGQTEETDYGEQGAKSQAEESLLKEPSEEIEEAEEVEVAAPVEEPEEESQPSVDKATALLDSMNLEEKIYQMFIVTPEALQDVDVYSGGKPLTKADEETEEWLSYHPVGGICYFDENIKDRDQIKRMIQITRDAATIPLFISADEEGGRVARLMEKAGATKLDAMYSYRKDGPGKAKENAATIAEDMKELGFNLDFAPVADVWSNSKNKVIADRAYSDDFSQAADLVAAAVEGFGETGMICTLKHFPGHGDTKEDTHTGNAFAKKSLSDLRKEEFLPFEAGIEAGADLVMVGHMIVEDVDPERPASLSEKIVTGLLKEELGFEGLVITDALNMAAVANEYTSQDAAVMAVEAGADMLLMPYHLEHAVEGLIDAVKRGEISKERIDESVLKILKLKEACGILL